MQKSKIRLLNLFQIQLSLPLPGIGIKIYLSKKKGSLMEKNLLKIILKHF